MAAFTMELVRELVDLVPNDADSLEELLVVAAIGVDDAGFV